MHRRTGHVLVVDDDALNRRLLVGDARAGGEPDDPATDGAEALDAIREDPPDVVLLDIEMPGIDGFEVLARIKGDEAVRHLPVIMISGLDDTESVVRCLEIGADDFLPKPFDAAILRARMNAGLDKKALRDLERERVRDIFTRFLPEPMVDEVLARTDGDARIQPELLTGTVLFSDLRGFTSFAEGRPVDDVIEAINTYLTLMTDAVLDHGGTLVDYMGDGIMAAFGAPVASDEHADLALAAARAMAGEQLATFNAWLSATRRRGPDPDGDRDQLGPRGLGERRFAPKTRLRRDRRHDEHRIADRGDDEGARSRGPVLEATKDTLRELPEDAVVARRVRGPGPQRAHRTVGARRRGPHMTALDDEIRALRARVAELEAAEAERDRAERVQEALYRIAETASAAEDMGAFYAEIHRIVGELMYADNFYIALYDEERQAMNWPFYVDTVDKGGPIPTSGNRSVPGRPAASPRTSSGAVGRCCRPRRASRHSFARERSTCRRSLGHLARRATAGRGSDRRRRRRPELPGGRPTQRGDKELLTFVGRHIASALERTPADRRDAAAQRRARADQRRPAGLAENLDMQAMYELVGDRIHEIFDAQVVDIGISTRGQHDPLPVHARARRTLPGPADRDRPGPLGTC